ncbi:MAG: hypothetical protein LC772_09750, partial [Chloroflexi bacterium]|nr:hypothetical protein [Chloroflexota bacterium]
VRTHHSRPSRHGSSRSHTGGQAALTAPVMIRQSDQNKTVTVHVGQIVALNLKDDLTWSVQNNTAPVLKPLGKLDAHARLRAAAPGTVTLQAGGRPISHPGQMTAMFIILFKVTVRVVR